jgi:hypothetical protein
MKLRIRGDSLRLRLSRTEVTALAARGEVEDAVSFGGGVRLVYALRVRDGAAGERLTAALTSSPEGPRVDVHVAAGAARAWTGGDEVGIEATQETGPGQVLRILVEKDFACLTARAGEDDSDAFPNPSSTC